MGSTVQYYALTFCEHKYLLLSPFLDGQSIATRLAKQINRTTKSIKKDIQKYNDDDHTTIPQERLPLAIAFDEIKEPDSPFWWNLNAFNADPSQNQVSIPLSVKRKAIDLCHLLDRAKEEQALLKDEMHNVFLYYLQQHDLITDFILASNNTNTILDEVQLAELTYGRKKLLHVECRLSRIKETFSAHIDIELPRMFIMTDDQEDNEDVEEEEEAEEEDEEEAVIVNPVAEESDSDSDNESDEGDFFEGEGDILF